MAIQLFDLGPPRVDTFNSIANLGKSFFDAFDKSRARRLEDDAGAMSAEWGKSMLSGAGDQPAAPSRSIAEVGKTTPNGSADLSVPNLPTFARPETGQQLAALKSIESSGRYGITGPKHPRYGRALGAYQIMEANLPQWSREALGREVSPDEFLANPKLQDTIAAFKFQQYVDKFGNPQDAASAWLTGRPMAQAGGRRDVFGTDAPEYVRRFNAALGRAGAPQGPQVASLSPGMGYAPDPQPMRLPWDGSPMQAQPLPYDPAQGQPVQPAVTYRRDASTGGAAVAEPLWGDGSRPEHYKPQRTAALPPATFSDAVPGAMDAPGIGALPPGLPTIAGPAQAPAPAPRAPAPAPAPVPAPPVQTAQAPAQSASDGVPQSFQRLPPARQQLLIRMLQNPLTRAFAMQQIEALRKQDEWTFTQTPNGQFVRTNKQGRVEVVPGFDKPQDRYETYTDERGNIRQRNIVTNQETVLDRAEGWQTFKGEDGQQYAWNPRSPQQSPLPLGPKVGGYRNLVTPEERAQFGIPPEDKRPVQVKPNGELVFPSKAQVENTTNFNEGDAFKKAMAPKQAEAFNDMINDGMAARTDLANIRRLRGQIGKLPGGFLGGVQAWANSYGIKLGPNVSNVEAAGSLIDKLVPAQRQGMPGAASDRDVAMFKNALPKLSNTPTGNKLILNTLEGLAIHRQRMAEIAGRVADGEITPQQGRKLISELPDPFDAFRSDEEAMSAAGEAPASIGDLDVGGKTTAPRGVIIQRTK